MSRPYQWSSNGKRLDVYFDHSPRVRKSLRGLKVTIRSGHGTPQDSQLKELLPKLLEYILTDWRPYWRFTLVAKPITFTQLMGSGPRRASKASRKNSRSKQPV